MSPNYRAVWQWWSVKENREELLNTIKQALLKLLEESNSEKCLIAKEYIKFKRSEEQFVNDSLTKLSNQVALIPIKIEFRKDRWMQGLVKNLITEMQQNTEDLSQPQNATHFLKKFETFSDYELMKSFVTKQAKDDLFAAFAHEAYPHFLSIFCLLKKENRTVAASENNDLSTVDSELCDEFNDDFDIETHSSELPHLSAASDFSMILINNNVEINDVLKKANNATNEKPEVLTSLIAANKINLSKKNPHQINQLRAYLGARGLHEFFNMQAMIKKVFVELESPKKIISLNLNYLAYTEEKNSIETPRGQLTPRLVQAASKSLEKTFSTNMASSSSLANLTFDQIEYIKLFMGYVEGLHSVIAAIANFNRQTEMNLNDENTDSGRQKLFTRLTTTLAKLISDYSADADELESSVALTK